MVHDIHALLDPAIKRDDDEPGSQLLSLWDPDAGTLPAGINYGSDPD